MTLERERPSAQVPPCIPAHLQPLELFFNKKHCRRRATRYDQFAAHYLAFVQLASIRLSLRVDKSAFWMILVETATQRVVHKIDDSCVRAIVSRGPVGPVAAYAPDGRGCYSTATSRNVVGAIVTPPKAKGRS